MKKYTEMMEHIRPTDCRKNKMLEKAFENSEKLPKRRFKFKYLAVLAAAAMIFSTTTVFADDIKEMFYNLLGKNELVSEDVLNEIYSDNDGHVKITVKELLSDKISSYAIVEYTALDEKGKWWIDKSLVVESEDYVNLHINYPELEPNYKDNNTALYGVNCGYGAEELTEYHTENSRVFKLTCQASGENFGTDSMKLKYNLLDKFGVEANINVSESVQLTDIKIDNSNAPDRTYKPLGVKISPLSFMIYGKNCGNYESGVNSLGGYYIRSLSDEMISSLYLVMKDGKRYDMDDNFPESERFGAGGASLTSVTNPDVDYDICIYTGYFSQEEPVDISLIAGFELDGVYYPIDAENPQ